MEKELKKLEWTLACNKSGLSTAEVSEILRCKSKVYGMTKYSAEELSIAFDYYRKFIIEINKETLYPPTKKSFCGFIGISSQTFDKYKISDDDRLREVTNMIDDYVTDSNLTLAQKREIDNVTTIFRSKAEHGMIEAQAPIVVEHKAITDTDKIKAQIEAVKHGKSLKTIELIKKSDGTYGPKEDI